jgi:RNase adapter protein RapZ
VSEYLVVTGMSGAGRSSASADLEDMGWFVIDNLPPALIGKVADLAGQRGSEYERVALVIGRSGNEAVVELQDAVAELRSGGAYVRILYLDAPDEVLIRRFKGTRRPHPLESADVLESIKRERVMLEPLKSDADVIVDTGDLSVHQLRERMSDLFAGLGEPTGTTKISLISFGFKHGLPLDADLVFDARFLPNPHWVAELRPLTGLDAGVRDYVLTQPDAKEFLDRLDDLFRLLLPGYVKEGKSYLSIAIGCTGGRHRSVALAEELAARIRDQGFELSIHHRDIDR